MLSLQQTSPLSQIIDAANSQRVNIGHIRIVHQDNTGKVAMVANQRGQLVLQVFPRVMPAINIPANLVLGRYNQASRTWSLDCDHDIAEAWFSDAREFFGVEQPTPLPSHPADDIAADLRNEYGAMGQMFTDRLERAVEMVKSGSYDPAKYNTEWLPFGYLGCWTCQCPDATYRQHEANTIGQLCKHTLAGLITQRLEQRSESVAQREWFEEQQRRWDAAHPADDYAVEGQTTFVSGPRWDDDEIPF